LRLAPPELALEGRMFKGFTDRARRVVVLAQEEARLLAHNYIGGSSPTAGLPRLLEVAIDCTPSHRCATTPGVGSGP
jgi:hypothetical protein